MPMTSGSPGFSSHCTEVATVSMANCSCLERVKKHVIIEYVICDGFLEKPGNISFSLSSIPRFPSCKTATGEKKVYKGRGFS